MNETMTALVRQAETETEIQVPAIQSPADYELVASELRRLIQSRNQAMAEFERVYRPAWETVQELRTWRRRICRPYDDLEMQLKLALANWRTAEERLLAATPLEAVLSPFESVSENTGPPETSNIIPESPAKSTAEGIRVRDHWRAEVVDMKALVAAVHNGDVPEDFVEPNMKRIGEVARAMREAFSVPGCRAVKSKSVQVRP